VIIREISIHSLLEFPKNADEKNKICRIQFLNLAIKYFFNCFSVSDLCRVVSMTTAATMRADWTGQLFAYKICPSK